MPPKGKRQNVNHHDKRHENGLAAPGKRESKQRSDPKLNSHPNGNPIRSSSIDSSNTPDQHTTLPTLPISGAATGDAEESNMAHTRKAFACEEERRESETSSDCPDPTATPRSSEPSVTGSHRRQETSGSKPSAVPGVHALSVATTILRSCPLRDVLAILIILIQLPPTLLTIIQCLFALLTFVPPSTTGGLSSLQFTVNDFFQGSGGAPSMQTILVSDVIALLIWLVLWDPVQSFALDLAQAVIAISLGGGITGKGGSTWSIISCSVIIGILQVIRRQLYRQYGLNFLWTYLSRANLISLESPTPSAEKLDVPRTAYSLGHSVLGIHILTQGMVRIIRRSLARREASHNTAATKKLDPEAGTSTSGLSNSKLNELNPDVASSSSPDTRTSGFPPAGREGRERIPTSKQKRKQATHVRSQQPFWAAVASTKVTVLKEMEQSQASSDATEAAALDMRNLGNAVASAEEDRVWIEEVGSTEVRFSASLAQTQDFVDADSKNPGASNGRRQRLYVRVNGANWTSTTVKETSTNDDDGEGASVWSGEISGLTASSVYLCEFVRTSDNEILYAISLTTPSAPHAEPASSPSPTAPTPQALRPSSPISTLKNSITAAEAKLMDQRNRVKRHKKDHKSCLTTLRKEVENATSRLSSSGGNDDRQRQKILQINQHIRQAEECVSEAALEVDKLGKVPEEEIGRASSMEASWQKELDNLESLQREYENAKSASERQIADVQGEITNTAQKRERLVARQARLNEQHERLEVANREWRDKQEKRKYDSDNKAHNREISKQHYESCIAGWNRQAAEIEAKTTTVYQQTLFLENLFQQQQQQQKHASYGLAATTPEGILPGTNSGYRFQLPFPGYPFPGSSEPTIEQRGPRGRSSSMLSDVSGFTDKLDQPIRSNSNPLGNLLPTIGDEQTRKGSSGSAGGYGSPPVKHLSPIGTASTRTPPRVPETSSM